MPIPTLPTPPSRADSATFAARADAFLAALPAFATEANALQVDVNAKQTAVAVAAAQTIAAAAAAQASATSAVSSPFTNATSTTSLAVALGSKALTIQASKNIVVGMSLKLASAGSPLNWMYGDCTAYNSTTGALTVQVTQAQGTGTFADWVVSLSGPYGQSNENEGFPTIRPALLQDFINGADDDYFDPRITFTRASSAMRTNKVGLLELVGNNKWRTNYDPITLAKLGRLIEEARTNALSYSSDFSNAIWGKNASPTLTPNYGVAPDGTATSTRLQGTGFSSGVVRSPNYASGVTATASIFVKPVSGSGKLRLGCDTGSATPAVIDFVPSTGLIANTSGGVVGTPVVTPYRNGWYRISLSYTTNSATNSFVAFQADATALDCEIWLAQSETGAFVSSPIPTTTSGATRAAEVAYIDGANFAPWFNPAQGTLVTESDCAGLAIAGGAAVVAAFTNGTNSNLIIGGQYVNGPAIRSLAVADTDVTVATLQQSNVLGITRKTAGAYQLNNFAGAVDGGAVLTDSSGTVPQVNQLRLGGIHGQQHLNGHLRAIAYYPVRLPDSQLQALSA